MNIFCNSGSVFFSYLSIPSLTFTFFTIALAAVGLMEVSSSGPLLLLITYAVCMLLLL